MSDSPAEPQDASPALDHAGIEPAIYEGRLLGRLDRKVFASAAARWAVMVVLGALIVFSSFQFLRKIDTVELSEYRAAGFKHRTALGRWLPDARALVDGKDPYGVGHWFPCPPLVLMSLVPLAYLPLHAAAVLWALAKIAAIVAACSLILESSKRGKIGIPFGVMLAAAVFSIRPIMGDITHGNINIFVLFEIALAWYLFVNHRDLLAGVVIGLALVTKVTPGLLLVYFVYRRQWRVAAGAGIGLLLFAIVIPTLFLGWERNIDLLGGWFKLMVDPSVFQGYITFTIDNQSLSGMLIRYIDFLGISDVQQIGFDEARVFGVPPGEMARPISFVGKAIVRAASLSIVVALAWLCRSRFKDRRDPRLLLELALVLIAMLLLSERTWKHHLTTLPIVYLAVWWVLACYPWSKSFTAWFATGLVAQLLALLVLKGDFMLGLGVVTWGLLICFFQIGILLRRMQSRYSEVCP